MPRWADNDFRPIIKKPVNQMSVDISCAEAGKQLKPTGQDATRRWVGEKTVLKYKDGRPLI